MTARVLGHVLFSFVYLKDEIMFLQKKKKEGKPQVQSEWIVSMYEPRCSGLHMDS